MQDIILYVIYVTSYILNTVTKKTCIAFLLFFVFTNFEKLVFTLCRNQKEYTTRKGTKLLRNIFT